MVAGIVASAFDVIVAIFSEDTFHDIIAALGIMIYWYYGITAFARAWYVRKELFTSLYNFLFKLTSPLLAGLIPAAVFAYSIRESMRTPGRSGAAIAGIGRCSTWPSASSDWCGPHAGHRAARPPFFQGKTLARDAPALIAEE